MITAGDVREGMERGELFLEYQPIVMLSDQRCIGAEALVRWSRDGAVIPPDEFIPVIENTPVSGSFTYWMIDRVSEEFGDWLGDHDDAYIAINVPPEILGRGGLEYAAKRGRLKGRIDQIVLEISERGVPDRLGLDALNQMAHLGVRVALDDAAMSGVNLAVLTRCNFSIVKIDHGLTSQIQEGKPMPDWLAGLSALLHSSSLNIVAEGIETPYQAEALMTAGVGIGQGYLFSRPISASQFKEFHERASRRTH